MTNQSITKFEVNYNGSAFLLDVAEGKMMLDEFEEIVPVIRGAYRLLGENIYQDILCNGQNGGG